MPHRDALPDPAGLAAVGVDDAAVLQIGAGADQDGCVVRTQDGVVPDVCLSAEVNAADDSGAVGDVGGSLQLGSGLADRIKHKKTPFKMRWQKVGRKNITPCPAAEVMRKTVLHSLK